MIQRRHLIHALATLPALGIGACAARGRHVTDGPALQVRGSLETLEIAPVLLAARHFFPGGADVRNGGIGNLVGAPRVASLGDEGRADIATHAETQALRYSVDRPDLRIILTVTEGSYRIVARRSAGVAALRDLRGKRIATIPTTSAGFFLARMLEQAGLRLDDVAIARVSPLSGMAAALARHEVDAVAIWEPHAANAARLIGKDAITFSGDGVYRELFNLNSTAANLADPVLRPRIVAFVRAVIDASRAIRRDPRVAQQLLATTGGFTRDELTASWPTLAFPADLPADLLDVLVLEEQWLAQQERRAPRGRDRLASLIDASILREARGRTRR